MKVVVGFVKSGKKRDMDRQERAIWAYCTKSQVMLDGIVVVKDWDECVYGDWMGRRKIDAVVAASNMDVTANAFEFYAYRCKMRMRNSDLWVAEWTDYPGYGLYRKILEEFTDILVRKEMAHEPILRKNGRIRKASQGGYIGGKAPMGYKVVSGRLEVNPEEVPVVRFIMDEKHRGGTKLGTVEKLNAQGYKTRRGGAFQISTVQGIWNNEKFYKGFYRLKGTGEWVKGQHEAIL